MARWWGWPLVPLYAAGLAVNHGLRAAGVLRTRKLEWPVVSVGSVSSGGAGKTPVVIALAKLMRGAGWGVDVLSRGYGREGSGVERVGDDAQRFGDEPVLIARAAKVPVWVGADRFAAGQAVEEADPFAALRDDNKKEMGDDSLRRVHLLDDGFQHRQLRRDVDVVLVTAEDLDDALLPAGNRREPLNALRRADVVVIREEERGRVETRVKALIREGALLWGVRRKLVFPAPLGVLGSGLRPLAFCAIARPEGFAEMLQKAGCGVIDTVIFDDHHGYAMSDVEQILAIAKRLNASGFVTTEKDAVKLSTTLRAKLETVGPVLVVGLDVQFVDEAEVMRELEARCR